MKINIKLNGRTREFHVTPDEFLLDTLRENNILSVKKGCDNTTCGVCTVLLDGKPVPSCSLLSIKANNKSITTVEGIQSFSEQLSEYFGHEGADQCGFCNPSLAVNVYAMLEENSEPTDEEIKEYLVGNLCRCTGYQSQHIAIRKFLEGKK